MIPGTTSKLSESSLVAATTISPKTDVCFVLGTTAIARIVPAYEGFSGLLIIVPNGALTTVTSGNIALAVTMTTSAPVVFIYSKVNNLWYPGAIS